MKKQKAGTIWAAYRGNGRKHIRILAAALTAAGLLPTAALAQSASWNTNVGSPASWGTVGNWNPAQVPNGQDNTATFATPGLTGPYTVFLDQPRTIGNLVFDNPTNLFSWTIDQNVGGGGPFSLMLQTSGATAPSIAVNKSGLSAIISALLQDNGSQGFTKTGAGNLSLTASNLYGGPTVVNGGTLTADFSPGLTGSNILPSGTNVTLQGGGSLLLNAGSAQSVSQSVSSVAVGAGTSVVGSTVPIQRGQTAVSSGASISVNLNALNRNAGGILVLNTPQLATATAPALPALGASYTTTNTNNLATNGILGGWAIMYLAPVNTYTLNGTTVAEVQQGSQMSWASLGTGSNVIGPAGSTGFSALTADTFTSTVNDNVTVTGPTTITNGTTNSVRFNNGNILGYTLTMAAGSLNTITTGGILVTQNANANTPDVINGTGQLTSGANDLIVSEFNPYNTMTISAPIVGAGKGLTTGGNGVTVISGANSYTGPTNVSGGILLAANTGALPGFNAAGQVVVNSAGGATPSVNFPAPTMSVLAVSAGGTGWTSANIDTLLANATFIAGGALGIDVPAVNSPFAYNSNIGGVQGLTKTNAGTLTLGGTSTYTGATTILGGILSVGTITNSGSAGPLGGGSTIAFGGMPFTGPGASVTVVPGAAAPATLQYTGGVASTNRNITLGEGGGTIITTNALTLAGNISGQSGLTFAGGVVNLTGAGTYLGPTIVTGGSTLNVGASGALPATTDLIVNSGASVSYANGVAVNLGSLSGGGGVTFGNATTVNIGGDSASGVYRGSIGNGSGGATTLVKAGSGIQVYTGNNTFTGGLTINGGTVQASPQTAGPNPLGAGTVTLNGPGTGISIAQLAFRQTMPIGAIGWNHDTIWSSSEPTAAQGVTYPLDAANTFIANNVGPTTSQQAGVLPNGVTSLPGGLPVNRAINLNTNGLAGGVLGTNAPLAGPQLTTGATYLMQNYNGLNTMALLPQASGTLSLTTPDSFKTINVLTAFPNGGAGTTYNAILNFTSGTPTTVSLSSLDWFGTANTGVIGALGRYNVMSNVFDARTSTGFPQLYQQTISLSAADQLRTLTSITFTNTTTAGGTGVLAVFALNGVGANVPSALTPGNNVAITASANLEVSGYTSVAMGTLSLPGATITVNGTAGSSLTFTGTTLTGAPTINVPTGMTMSLGTVTDNNGGFGLTKTGAGQLTLGGGASYLGGAVAVNGGILFANTPAALPARTTSGAVTVASGTALVVGVGSAGQWASSDITTLLTNASFTSGSSFGMDVAPSVTATLTSAISLPAGVGFLKNDGGTLVLASGASSYAGSTTINGGILSTDTLANGGQPSGIGSSTNAAANLVFANGATLRYTGATVTIDRAFTLNTSTTTPTGGGFDVATAGTTLTVSGAGTGGGGFIKNGPGTLILTGTNAYTGGTTINAGTLQIGNGGTAGAIGTGGITDNGTLAYNLNVAFTLSQVISGTGGVTEMGPQSLQLSSANTYTGPTNVTGGTLQAGNASAFGVGSAVTTFTGGTLSLNGFSVSIGSLSGTAGTVNDNTATASTLSVGSNNASTTYGGLIANGAAGALSLIKNGVGTLTLTNTLNSYSGGTTINSGTLAVASDTALGTGPVTITALGTLSYSATTATSKSFTLGNGTLAVNGGAILTLNGGTLASGFLGGLGTFATGATGAQFAAVTSRPAVTIQSNSGNDQFVNFTNGGLLNVAANLASAVTFNGFTNQGSGSIIVGQNTQLNASDFQSYGTLTLNPGSFNGTSGGVTQITNTGGAPLYFNGGSRTFISTVAQAANGNAGFDLHGNDAVVAGGLFVNNGYVYDSVGAGTHRVVADYGALVKGAGFYQPLPKTINGGTFIAGNSPGHATTGTIVLGGPNDPNGGLSDFTWQINDAGPSASHPSATGMSGPSANAAGRVSGWGTLLAVAGTSPLATTGNMQWDATPSDKLTIHLATLLAPSDSAGNASASGGYGAAGDMTPGLMTDFDPSQSYSWRLFGYQGSYTGPTDTASLDASTNLDASGFLNPHAGRFDLVLNQASQEMDLVFTPTAVPEPGTLALVGAAGVLLVRRVRRKRTGR
jgi:autotransporter-associated beta strand protein